MSKERKHTHNTHTHTHTHTAPGNSKRKNSPVSDVLAVQIRHTLCDVGQKGSELLAAQARAVLLRALAHKVFQVAVSAREGGKKKG